MSNGQLYFPLAEAVRVGEATMEATEHGDSFGDHQDGQKTGPALMWVKDAGTYLMSNAVPRPEGDVIYGRAHSADGLLLEQRAHMDAADLDDVWHTTRYICGGDDFAEYLPLPGLLPQLRAALDAGATHLVIDVSDDAVEIRTEATK